MCEPISATAAATAATGAASAGAASAGAASAGAATLSTFQIASLALTAGSTLLGAYGQAQAGEAQSAQLSYQAAVNRNNQIIANQQAEDAEKRGDIAEKQHRLQIAQLKGRQKTALAASGIEVDSGTALDVLADTAEIGEFEALTIRHNAEQEARGHRIQAANFGSSATNNTLAASSASSSGTTNAVSTLLGGAGSVASKWYSFKKGF